MNKIILLNFLVVIVVVHTTTIQKELFSPKWLQFKATFNKHYKTSKEELNRWRLFSKASDRIEEHNKRFAAGEVTYELELNHLSDLTDDEIASTFFGYNGTSTDINDLQSLTYVDKTTSTPPLSIDWRARGAVTGVKDQGRCGSCWAFSATGVIEGVHFRKTGKLVSFSEQNPVDCSTKDSGCQGGWPWRALEYVITNKGINEYSKYPYKGQQGQCNYKHYNSDATISAVRTIPSGNEDLLLKAVVTEGPISVAINAGLRSFQSYKSGVYNDPKCSSNILNHAVLIVGYGADRKYGKYWIVKNSWSNQWGDKGYIKMARGKNICGIAQVATYALF